MRPMFSAARIVAAAVLLAGAPRAGAAQGMAPSAASAVAPFAAVSPSGAHSFAIEAAGGVAGSMLGFGVIYLSSDRCEVEDLGCTLESVFAGMVLGTAASAAGAYFAGKAGNTDPSLLGASLGAIVGAGAGVGLWHIFTEELDVGNRRIAAVLSYTVAQGLTTALGSRLLRRLRPDA